MNKEIIQFWKPLIYTNGKIDEKKVMNELADFYFIMKEVPKVYLEITGGLLSKLKYPAETVLSEFHEKFLDKEITKDDVEMMVEESKTLDELKDILEEYFEFLPKKKN